MADYKEVSVAGTSWRRAKLVTITNPMGGIPMISFAEEDVIKMADGTVFTSGHSTYCDARFEPEATFPIFNPVTGEATGATMTQAELYAIVYSLYMDAAAKRDNPAPVVLPPAPGMGNPVPDPLLLVIPPSSDPAPGP
jgi:hypothetical protein